MNLVSPIAVAGGAGVGALIRWMLGLALDAIFPSIPLGTLVANVIGGFLMGLVIGSLDQFQTLPFEWRLAITTGFLGGLTTFSTFSAESVTLLLRQQYGWAAALVAAHTIGSIVATFAGYGLFRLLAKP